MIERLEDIIPTESHQVEQVPFNTYLLFFYIILAGAVLLLARILFRYLSYRRVLMSGKLISDGDPAIYDTEAAAPFSFGNAIFINHSLYKDESLTKIISHEAVHVKQNHTADIMWAEIFLALNWYNPFAWLIKTAIKQNLEFIVDGQLVKEGIDIKKYQYLLISVMSRPISPLMNHLNISGVKSRLKMMYCKQSHYIQLTKYFLLVPVLLLLLTAFRRGEDITQIVIPPVSHHPTAEYNNAFSQAVPQQKASSPTKTNKLRKAGGVKEKDSALDLPKRIDPTPTEATSLPVSTFEQAELDMINKTDEKLLLIFDHTTSKEKLVNMIAQVKAIGANLIFEDSEFNEQGILVKGKGILTFPDQPRLRGSFYHNADNPSFVRLLKTDGSYNFSLGAYSLRPAVRI